MKLKAKGLLSFLVTAIILLCTNSCNKEENSIAVTQVELNKSVLGILVGETYTLEATSNLENSTIEWSSSKTTVATVNNEGLVVGISPGTTIITTEVGNGKAICTVVIKEKELILELNKANLTLFSFPTYKETLQVITDIGDNNVTWESSDESVATVNENGEVVPLAVGVSIISASVNDVTTVCIVTVIEGPVTLLELDQTELKMDKFDTVKLNISSLETQAEETGLQVWQSSNENLVTVDDEGNLTSYGLEGTAIITLTIDNLTVECLVTIGPTVYVTGDDGDIVSLWQNEISTTLTDENSDSNGNFVYVDGEDVYVAGYTSNGAERIATVWKNEEILYSLTDGTKDAKAKTVIIDGLDVYTTGYEDDEQGDKIAKVWRNETILYELTDGSNDALAYSTYIDSGDIYTVGYDKNLNDTLVSKVWRNGLLLYTLTNGDFDSIANSVHVIAGDIYVAGYEKNPNNTLVAKVWRNDTELYALTDGQNGANAYSLYLDGNDIYVAGYENDNQGGRVAKVWLNGNEFYDLTSSTDEARAYSVYIYEDDIYAAGYEENDEGIEVAKVWKNGEELYELSNGSVDTRAYSVHVE